MTQSFVGWELLRLPQRLHLVGADEPPSVPHYAVGLEAAFPDPPANGPVTDGKALGGLGHADHLRHRRG
ncbi:MAG TPA: hypothetical protein VMU65_02950 [Candidatus Saccharimonadales bacterium]|nr:hypothetical protein [Candidatus Saccharimonadales bacterium]